MPLTVPVAHDFFCPWCWVALHQVERLRREFGIVPEWRGYELFPEGMEWPDGAPAEPGPEGKAPVPTRFDLMAAAEGLVMPPMEKPHKMRTFRTHQAVEHVRATGGDADAFISVLYHAYYERGANINEIPVLLDLAAPFCPDLEAMEAAIARRAYRDRVVEYDEPAHATGVWNVPTFWIGGERYAEQPYRVLADAVRREIGVDDDLYAHPNFGPVPEGRPYVYIDMVQTVDGKILPGNRNESAAGLGSAVDQSSMRRLEAAADAVMVGAQTLRATTTRWDPGTKWRIVLTQSGNLPRDAAFFTGGEAIVASPGAEVEGPTQMASDDLPALLRDLRARGIERLLVLGGAEINAQFLADGLVDELFVTMAPKIRLGRDIPTFADGEPLPSPEVWKLVSNITVGDEVFLRYRRQYEG